MMEGIPYTALGREENKLVVIRTKPTCMGRTSATAHICITNKEIGHICMVVKRLRYGTIMTPCVGSGSLLWERKMA